VYASYPNPQSPPSPDSSVATADEEKLWVVPIFAQEYIYL